MGDLPKDAPGVAGSYIMDATAQDRYARKQLKPMTKSVYQNNKVHRLNGSLNGVVGAPSLSMNTSAKVL